MMEQDEPEAGSAQAPADPGNSLIETVLLPGARESAESLAETGLEMFLGNPLIDKLPVVSLFVGSYRGIAGFREWHFARKFASLMGGIGDPSPQDRENWSRRLSEPDGDGELGERLVAVLDRMTARTKADLLGRAFRRFLDGTCSRAEFMRCAEMIDGALTEDLRFLTEDWSEGSEDPACARLIAAGLMVDRSAHLSLTDSGPPDLAPEAELLRGTR